MSQDRDMKIFMATAAQKAQRYEDSVNFIKSAILIDPKLSDNEQKLFLQVYKACVDLRRNDIQFIISVEKYQQKKKRVQIADKLEEYYRKLYNELSAYCYEIISLIDNFIIVKATTAEEKIFYLTIKADFYRYLSESLSENDAFNLTSKANEFYKESINTAKSSISPASPIYCNTILNYSVFLYEILQHKSDGLIIAEDFVGKIQDIESDEPGFLSTETLEIIKRIKENVDMWNREIKSSGLEDDI